MTCIEVTESEKTENEMTADRKLNFRAQKSQQQNVIERHNRGREDVEKKTGCEITWCLNICPEPGQGIQDKKLVHH